VDLHRRESFPLLRFDDAGPVYLAHFEALCRRERLPFRRAEAEAFFESSLVHESAEDDDGIPAPAAELFDYLNRHRLRAEGSPD
jgi:hypothetical protein